MMQVQGEWSLARAIDEVAACPKCHGPIAYHDSGSLVCRACSLEFSLRSGIPCMEVEKRSEALSREVEWYEQGEPNPQMGCATAPARRFRDGHHLAHAKARAGITGALRDAGITSSSKVLSVATGHGSEIPLIEEVSKRICGLDLALVALRRFREKFPYPVFQGNVRTLPFKDRAFDACVVSGLLHHLVGHDDLVGYLVEFRRVLCPGGALIVVEPNSLYPVQWILGPVNRVVQRYRPGWRGLVPHERPISPWFIAARLREAGYRDVQYVGATFLHNRMPAILCRIVDVVEDHVRTRSPFRLFAWFVLMTARCRDDRS